VLRSFPLALELRDILQEKPLRTSALPSAPSALKKGYYSDAKGFDMSPELQLSVLSSSIVLVKFNRRYTQMHADARSEIFLQVDVSHRPKSCKA